MRAVDARHYWLEAIFRHDDPGWNGDIYPFNLPVLRGLDRLTFHPRVTFFVGENGSGKSTLIEALAAAWGFNPEGGSVNMRFSTRDSHSPLYRFVRPVRGALRPKDGYFLRAESFFTTASYVREVGALGSHGGRDLHEQSHGESFFALFDNRFFGKGLYILDEPEAALSPTRQMTFLARMHELVADDSQFIIATHSPIILGYPDADIWQVSRFGLDKVEYEDTEHVQVTRQFLNHRDIMLKTLLDDDDAE